MMANLIVEIGADRLDILERIDSLGMGAYSLGSAASPDYPCNREIHIFVGTGRHSLNMVRTVSQSPINQRKVGLVTRRIYGEKMEGYTWVEQFKLPFTSITCDIPPEWDMLKIDVDESVDLTGSLLFYSLADIFAHVFLNYYSVVLHGAAMEYNGQGIILSAPSQTGKTTHANLWVEMGLSRIINGDRALLRKNDCKWRVFGMPWCGSSGQSINASVPVSAIVFLQQHKENAIQRLQPLDAILHLLRNGIAPRWEPTLYQKMLGRVEEIVECIPIYILRCRPDVDAVMTLKREMDNLAEQNNSVCS